MCRFITIAVPAETPEHRLREALRSYAKTFGALADAAARKLFHVPVHYGTTTRDHCDCSSAVGSVPRARLNPDWIEDEVRKLRRKKWNNSRIRAWQAKQLLLQNEAAQWVSILRDLVEVSSTSCIWLLLHSYSGDLGREAIRLRSREFVAIDGLSPEFILGIEEDLLYEFGKRDARAVTPADKADN